MKKEREQVSSGRRGFLKMLGLASLGGVATAGTRWSLLRSEEQKLAVGVVAPATSSDRSLTDQFINGLHLGIERDGKRQKPMIDLRVELSSPTPSDTLLRAEKLLSDPTVHGLVVYGGASLLPDIEELAARANRFVLFNDIGATIPSRSLAGSLVLRNSFQLWQSAHELGRWAASHVGQRAVINTSFYDSGYDTSYAFRRGFEEAGGQILATQIPDSPPAFNNPAPQVESIRSLNPDFVFCAMSGQAAITYLRAYGDSPLAGRVPLIGSSFLVEDKLLAAQHNAASGVRSMSSWIPGLAHETNRDFVARYTQAYRTQPEALALLGFESGLALEQARAQVGVCSNDPARLMRTMLTATIDSPRGALRFDESTRTSTSPLVLHEVRSGLGGFRNEALQEFSPLADSDERVLADLGPIRSGWTNPYPFA